MLSQLSMQSEKISVEDYLKGELISDLKHQLIGGEVYAMAGASANHERISANIIRKTGNHLEDSPCEPFGSDMKVKAGENFFYPDVTVDCNFDESEPYFTESPIIIVEVISKSTRKMDESTKLTSYLKLPSLQEYILVEQDFVDVEVLSRKENWFPRHYFLGDELTLESIDLTLSVEEIYRRVNNADVLEYLANKQETEDAG